MNFLGNLFNKLLFSRKEEKYTEINWSEIQQSDMKYLGDLTRKIDAINLNDFDYSEIVNLIRGLTKGHPTPVLTLDKNTFVWRIVTYPEKPKNFKNLIYPPPEQACQNRANKHGDSMFYGAFHKDTPLLELKVNPGDFFVRSKWCWNKTNRVINIGYDVENITKYNSDREIPSWKRVEFPGLNKGVYNFTEKYLSERFSQEILPGSENIYNLTNAIAEAMISQKERHGLIYPSIANKLVGDNIVLKQSFIDEGGLKFINAEWIKIVKKEDNRHYYEFFDFADEIGRDGFIYWKGRRGLIDVSKSPGYYFDDIDNEFKDASGAVIEKS